MVTIDKNEIARLTEEHGGVWGLSTWKPSFSRVSTSRAEDLNSCKPSSANCQMACEIRPNSSTTAGRLSQSRTNCFSALRRVRAQLGQC